jgi:hypothetical protein
VGIKDRDTGKQWYWQEGSAEVVQDDGGTTPPAGSVVSVTAQGYQSTVIDGGQDNDSVSERATAEGGSGLHMVLIENQTPGTAADAKATAQAWLAKFAKVPRVVEYATDYYGDLRAGQYQRIAITTDAFSFDSTFLIESVTLANEGGNWIWRVRAVNGALAGEWVAKMRKLATAGRGSVSGSAVSAASAGEGGTIDSRLITVAPDGSGNVAIDLGANQRSFLLVLDGTAATMKKPIFTGGTITAGLRFVLYLDEDATGGHDGPTYETGSGGFTTDEGLAEVDGRAGRRTFQQFTFDADADRWVLDFYRLGVATS